MKKYDVIVIGAGSGGLTVAVGLSQLGKSIALVEKGEIGGDCTNFGCVPSKSLLHSSKKNHPDALNRVRAIREEIIKEDHKIVSDNKNIEYIKGTASFIDRHTLSIQREKDQQFISAKHIVISTGASPKIAEVKNLPWEKLQTNETVFNLKKTPKNLAIIGGGYIGIELAEAFANLETKVFVLMHGEEILSKLESSISKIIRENLEEKGVTFYPNCSDYSWSNDSLTFTSSAKKKTIKNLSDGVLLAVGRKPNTSSLEIEKIGIQIDKRGYIEIDSSYKTSVSNIFAIGDCTTKGGFTHLANAEGRRVVQKIAFPYLPVKKIKTVPKVIYTHPEIAETGITHKEIQNMDVSQYYKIEVDGTKSDRAKTDDIEFAHLIVYVTKVTGRLLRVVYVAPHAGESIAYWQMAMEQKISAWKLYFGMLPYPTLSLTFKKALDIFFQKSLTNIKRDIASHITYFLHKNKRLIFALSLWTVIILTSRSLMSYYGVSTQDALGGIANIMTESRLGIMLYIVAYILRPLLIFPAIVLTALAGFVYGLQKGYAIALIAGTLSVLIPYLVGLKTSSKVDSDPKPTFSKILIMRLLYLPYDVVSVYAGLGKANFVSFMSATILGNILGTLTFVSIGASISLDALLNGNFSLDPQNALLSIALGVITILLTHFFKDKFGSIKLPEKS